MVKWKPHSASRSNWVTKTGLSFDPFDCAAVLSDQRLLCPKCKAAVDVREYSAPCSNSELNTLVISICHFRGNGLRSAEVFSRLPVLYLRNYQGNTCSCKVDDRSNCSPDARITDRGYRYAIISPVSSTLVMNFVILT